MQPENLKKEIFAPGSIENKDIVTEAVDSRKQEEAEVSSKRQRLDTAKHKFSWGRFITLVKDLGIFASASVSIAKLIDLLEQWEILP